MNATQIAILALAALGGVSSFCTLVGHAVPNTKIGKVCLAVGSDVKAVLAALGKPQP